MSRADAEGRTLVVGPSWLGDCVMALPALQRYAEASGCGVDLVAKPSVAPIWDLAPVVDRVLVLDRGLSGLGAVVSCVRSHDYRRAIVIPNSWRTGLVPLILDDGFQYLRLRPRVQVVLVDATNPFSNGHVLPRGVLREPIRNLRRCKRNASRSNRLARLRITARGNVRLLATTPKRPWASSPRRIHKTIWRPTNCRPPNASRNAPGLRSRI